VEDFFSSRALVDIAILITLLEGLALALYFVLTRKGIEPINFALNLLAGLCLMVALRNALTSSGWIWIALWLFLGGLAHWAEVVFRFKKQKRQNSKAG
jgi:hypothetical protein